MLESVRKNLSEAAAHNIERWLNEEKYSEYNVQLHSMITEERWPELEDAFFMEIEFGTAGIRGATGLGSAKISKITICEATQALCTYALTLDSAAAEKGIVIACDTRLTSEEFSRLTAQVCAGNGVNAYLFDGYRSTPELSFAVRHLGAAAGIVISASHNPPSDNGFKAYLHDGGQLVSPHDKNIVKLVKATEVVKTADFDEALQDGRIIMIGSEVDNAYISAVLEQSDTNERELHVIYSPLHGAGQRNSLPVLQQAGFKVEVVEQQMTPDGNFPTIENNKPNPEERAANDLAVAKMMAKSADIAITNDPDADRIGVIVRHSEEPKYLSGNQTAALATDFSLSKRASIVTKPYIAKTIVTTDLLDSIAAKYGVKVYKDMLIGFKYIGQLLLQKEESDETFIIGAEESFGMLKGEYARDKDGASGALVLAEYAAELKKDGKTLYDRLLELYAEHGVIVERLDTIVCPGARGFEQMQSIMTRLRNDPPKIIGSYPVTATTDYQTLTKRQADGSEESVSCTDTGNVIVLEFGEPRRRITIRPSGTEPKLKVYVQWHEPVKQDNSGAVETQYEDVLAVIEGISRELEGALL